MAILTSVLKPLSGIPEPKILKKVTTHLLEPLLSFDPKVYEGPVLSKKSGLEPLHTFIHDCPDFSAKGKKNFEARFSWGKISRAFPSLSGSLSTYIKYDAVDVELMLEALIKTSQLLAAPIAYLDVLDNDFKLRSNQHRDMYQEGKSGIDRVFGDFRGFSGIPWKTVLGPVYVEYFGVEKLRKLPPKLATEITDNYWLLTPCDDYKDWKSEVWCEGEKEIITTLGVDSFFNPMTKELAKKGPLIPEHSSLSIKVQTIRDEDSEMEWVYLNGYPKPE